MKQKYVLVRNITGGSKSFVDHLGSSRMLLPVGKTRDTVKILLDPANEASAVLKYKGIQKSGGLYIKFSDDIDTSIEQKKRTTISVPPSVNKDTAAKVDYLRKATSDEQKHDRLVTSRLARKKAEAVIKQKANITEEDLAEAVGTTLDNMTRTPKVSVEEKGLTPLVVEEGEDITYDSLAKLSIEELTKLAKDDLELVVVGNPDKELLIKLILETLEDVSSETT